MNCPLKSDGLWSEYDEGILLDYSAGRLDPAKTEMLKKHMLVCPLCSAYRTEQADVWAALDTWEAPPVSMGFSRRVLRRIEEQGAAPWYRKLADTLRLGGWKPAFPLAAAALVIAAGFVFDHQGTGPSTHGVSGASSVSITDVDQVERTLDDIQLLRQFDAAATSRPM
jgi:hypothetical protein